MSWNINKVDIYGEACDLDTSTGFQARILGASPTWKKLWKDNGIDSNDGDVIRFSSILKVIDDLKKDARFYFKTTEDADKDDVYDYIMQIVKVVEEAGDDDDTQGLAFW